jgi:hypothetical protein
LRAEQVTADEIALLLAGRRAAGAGALVSVRGAMPLLDFLCDRGVIPAPSTPTPIGPIGVLLAEYSLYLTAQRGLAGSSVLRGT